MPLKDLSIDELYEAPNMIMYLHVVAHLNQTVGSSMIEKAKQQYPAYFTTGQEDISVFYKHKEEWVIERVRQFRERIIKRKQTIDPYDLNKAGFKKKRREQ